MLQPQIKIGTKRQVVHKTACLIIIAGLISLGGLKAQDISPGQIKPLFQSEEILNLELAADFKEVFSVMDDSTYFPAKISLTDNAGLQRSVDIEIRTRGLTRREKDVCRFTPLRLNFPKQGTENTPFEGQKAIKLVTHCDRSITYEENTMIEYLIYKAYNVLTDSSFKVRPAIITYIYTGKKADTVQKFAFFLEREKHLADRLQGIELESAKMHPNRLNVMQTCLMDMFQYMIGNTDYSITEQHNIMVIADSSRIYSPIAVPYDFDWSGLVEADYAVPNPLIGTESVTERVYRGFIKEPYVVSNTIRVFNNKRQEIYGVFENFELLDNDRRDKAIKYLDKFYETINDERKVQIEFFDRARVEH